MATISLTAAAPADARELAANMRAQDAAEVRATGYEPEASLLYSMRVSDMAWTVRYDGEIMGMWGVVTVDLLNGVGVPWLLTSPVVEKHPRAFVRMSIDVLYILRGQYRVLSNLIDARYHMALRWARRMGFEVIPQSPATGLRGEPFFQVNMKGI